MSTLTDYLPSLLLPLPWLLVACAPLLTRDPGRAWQVAQVAALSSVLAALALLTASLASGLREQQALTLAACIMLQLISLLGWIIIRYSARLMQGEAGQQRAIAAFGITLACTTLVVVADHLLLLALAWSGTSFALHQLLRFHPQRPLAAVVAHRKFVSSRLADACLVLALLLIWQAAGTWSIAALTSWIGSTPALPFSLHAAALLIALAAALRCAQLPMHGWLIRVMEAPTPVSALLHAGIVNLGGFVLIRLAALLSAAPAAQALLVLVGGLTALLASLVLMTQSSIKSRLAWSTCAQMGFMLVECGLGLYELALLHLIAHSLYKAHAFLSAGETVTRTAQARQLVVRSIPGARGFVMRIGAAALATGLVTLLALGWQWTTGSEPVPAIALFIVGLGLAPLFAPTADWISGWLRRGMLLLLIVALPWFTWHALVSDVLHVGEVVPAGWMVGWTVFCFSLLYLAQSWILAWPDSALSRLLYPAASAGFHLDEAFEHQLLRPSRLSFPTRLPSRLRASHGGAEQ